MAEKIYVIIGSARPHWLGKKIANWITSVANENTEFEYAVVDLEDYNLPFIPKRFQRRRREAVSSWHSNFDDAAGFIFVTPEHKGDIPQNLKKAIHYLRNQWSNKPVGFVSYGYLSGKKAVGKLRETTGELNMLPVLDSVQIDAPWTAMNADGEFKSKKLEDNLQDMLNQLSQWVYSLNPQPVPIKI